MGRGVVTRYDPVHLLQRRRQHLTGVRRHLVPGESESTRDASSICCRCAGERRPALRLGPTRRRPVRRRSTSCPTAGRPPRAGERNAPLGGPASTFGILAPSPGHVTHTSLRARAPPGGGEGSRSGKHRGCCVCTVGAGGPGATGLSSFPPSPWGPGAPPSRAKRGHPDPNRP